MIPIENCVLCNKTNEHETKSDHLRTISMNRNGDLWNGFFRPRLTEDEKFIIKCRLGVPCEAQICSNRKKCTQRRSLIQ